MEPVLAIGTWRPALAAELARRGLRPAARGEAARAGLCLPGATAEAFAHMPLLQVIAGGDAAIAAALDAGAADAVDLSASDALIAARLAALVRRTATAGRLQVGDLSIDRVAQRAERGGRTLDLLPREYRLLLYLAERAGQVVPRADLLRAVWCLGFDPGTNVVAVHVSRLRAKLDRDFAAPLLRTEAGVGYRLAAA